MNTRQLLFTTLLVSLLSFSALRPAVGATLAEAMAEHLVCYPVELLSLDGQRPSISSRELCLAAIYHDRGGVPLWVDEQGPGATAAVIREFLGNAGQEGLEPATYQVDEIDALWDRREPASLARLDTLLTYNGVRYLHDVSHGRLTPYLEDPELFPEAGETAFDPVAVVGRLLASTDPAGMFRRAVPQNRYYRELRDGLARYRERLGGVSEWPPISFGALIRPGESDPRVPLIRQRLGVVLGEALPGGDSPRNDSDLAAAVGRFQELHGLKQDGVIGSNTLAELNVSPARRIEQIKLNMARWRWQAHDLGDEYVLVNIAGFHLYGYRDGEPRLDLPVIVGKLQHQTPVFSDTIKYIEFNPFWNIPPSIAVKEDLPKLRQNPSYLVERNIRLFSNWQADAVELDSTAIDWSSVSKARMARYKLRQDPGPDNALGRMKFVFPNSYAVYLHDTPKRNLFTEQHRSFSHGCIRVFTPEKLAAFLLEKGKRRLSEQDIALLIEGGAREIVRLVPPMPVHLTYQTAWLDKEGRIHFNRDIYGRDGKLAKALAREQE